MSFSGNDSSICFPVGFDGPFGINSPFDSSAARVNTVFNARLYGSFENIKRCTTSEVYFLINCYKIQFAYIVVSS